VYISPSSRDLDFGPFSPFLSFPRRLATTFKSTSGKHLLGNGLQVVGVRPFHSKCHQWVRYCEKWGLIKSARPASLEPQRAPCKTPLTSGASHHAYHPITDLWNQRSKDKYGVGIRTADYYSFHNNHIRRIVPKGEAAGDSKLRMNVSRCVNSWRGRSSKGLIRIGMTSRQQTG
jgi:hypothetical protein